MFNLAMRSVFVLGILFGLLFAVLVGALAVANLPTAEALPLALGLAVGISLLQFALSPFILQWIMRINWVDPEQGLMFPRSTDVDDSGGYEIPADVEEATCHLALFLLRKKRGELGPVDVGAMHAQGLSAAGSGALSVSAGRVPWNNWPPEVKLLMAKYRERGARTVAGKAEFWPNRRWWAGSIAP